MKVMHADAEARYELIRTEALKATQELLEAEGISIKVTGISPTALTHSMLWSKSIHRKVDWNWFEAYGEFKFQNPKRFEIALWYKAQLISLSMGKPTYAGTALRLDFIEASPRDLTPDRPDVFEATAYGYFIYAQMLGAKQIRIMHPINEKVRNYYESFGYTYVKGGDYLYLEVI